MVFKQTRLSGCKKKAGIDVRQMSKTYSSNIRSLLGKAIGAYM